MARLSGNDIASHQGDINYDVYKNNSHFVIMKASEGNGFTDPKFSRNQSESRRVGMLRGFYHFARPDLGNTPEAEAEWFLSRIGALQEGEVIALDYEPNPRNQAHVPWCRKFLDYVANKTGVKPLVYIDESTCNSLNWQEVVDGGYGLWIAKYLNTPNPDFTGFKTGKWQFAAMYQWTSGQQVPGIPVQRVDGDVFYGDQTTFKKYGFKPAPPPPPPVDWKAKYEAEVQSHTQTKEAFAKFKQDAAVDKDNAVKAAVKAETERVKKKVLELANSL